MLTRRAGQGLGDVADDAGMVVTDQLERQGLLRRRPLLTDTALHDRLQAFGLEQLQVGHQMLDLGLRQFDQQDAGKLAGQPRHPAFQPVAARGGDALGERADQPRAIASDQRQRQRRHGGPPGEPEFCRNDKSVAGGRASRSASAANPPRLDGSAHRIVSIWGRFREPSLARFAHSAHKGVA